MVQLWRVDVGRVSLFLLDTDRPENSVVGRWITSRLYEGSRSIRLAQYAVLGVGGARALAALGIHPSVFHLNEGHPALAAFELLHRARMAGGGVGRGAGPRWSNGSSSPPTRRCPRVTRRTAGTRSCSMLGRFAETTGDPERFLAAGRMDPWNHDAPSSMTVLALRASRSANAVSRRHGEVARAMWQPLFPDRRVDDVPITHR